MTARFVSAKEHYDLHLARVYAWMSGDFQMRAGEFRNFLSDHDVKPCSTGIAVDLGAGHGIQSIPLAERGFRVIAVDFNSHLLDELRARGREYDIRTHCEDIRGFRRLAEEPELIVCCGDTLAHLESMDELQVLLDDIAGSLPRQGRAIFSFRDTSHAVVGADRIIPVKSDETRIFTCVLDYEDDFVYVTDVVYEKRPEGWDQRASCYRKLRLRSEVVLARMEQSGLSAQVCQTVRGLTTVLSRRSR